MQGEVGTTYVPQVLTTVEFLMVAVAFGLMLQTQRRHTHEKWRLSRFAAELAHGSIMSALFLDPLEPRVARREPMWRRFALAVSLLAERAQGRVVGGEGFEGRKRFYLERRVEDQRDHYFAKLAPGAASWKRVLTLASFLAAFTAPVFIGVGLLLKVVAPEMVETNYVVAIFAALLPVALPLVAGAATSLLVAMDVGRRADRFKSVAARLGRIAGVIPGLKTEGALRRIVGETEDVLLDELLEWYAAAGNAGH